MRARYASVSGGVPRVHAHSLTGRAIYTRAVCTRASARCASKQGELFRECERARRSATNEFAHAMQRCDVRGIYKVGYNQPLVTVPPAQELGVTILQFLQGDGKIPNDYRFALRRRLSIILGMISFLIGWEGGFRANRVS